MVTTTTVYGFQKPAVAGDEDAWGGYLNNNIDKYESILTGSTTITSVVITTADINGGTLDNVVIGGSTAAAITGTTITASEDIVVSGTVDGRDLSADGAKLDGIESNATADQTKSDIDALNINADQVDGLEASQFLRSDAADTKTSGDLTFSDSVKAIFGAGSDLQIYHDGSHSYISDQGTGNLRILAAEFNVKSASGNTDLIYGVNGGAVTLYHNGNAKIATTSTGIDVTGTITADGLTVAGSAVIDDITINGSTISDGGDLTIDTAGTINLDCDFAAVVRFKDGGTHIGSLYSSTSNFAMYSAVQDKDILFQGNDGGSTVTALTLDMSAAGAATFNAGANFGGNVDINGNLTVEDGILYVGDVSGNNHVGILQDTTNGRGFTYQYDNASVFANLQGSTNQYIVLGDSAASSTETLFGVSIYQSGIYYTRMQLTGIGDLILPNGSLREDWDSVSGTTPTIANAGAYSLTMSGNTTFTFPSPAASYSTGFILQLTGNGSTVTYPNSVDFAGGTAPDAPGNGETDILVFWTRDGGTTWYGALAIDAAG